MRPASALLPVQPDVAFQVLEDPRNLVSLVIGARRVRRFDPHWPEAGSQLHHSLGVPPLMLHDTTKVVENVKNRRLRLEARAQFLGTFLVTLEFEPTDEGCRLSVGERAIDGLVSRPTVRPLTDLLIRTRNVVLCRRYRRLTSRLA